jgi:hypothetical protein
MDLDPGGPKSSGSPTLLEISFSLNFSVRIHGSVFFLLSLFAWLKKVGVGALVPIGNVSGSKICSRIRNPKPDPKITLINN